MVNQMPPYDYKTDGQSPLDKFGRPLPVARGANSIQVSAAEKAKEIFQQGYTTEGEEAAPVSDMATVEDAAH